mgnify:CR=1 FL=1
MWGGRERFLIIKKIPEDIFLRDFYMNLIKFFYLMRSNDRTSFSSAFIFFDANTLNISEMNGNIIP